MYTVLCVLYTETARITSHTNFMFAFDRISSLRALETTTSVCERQTSNNVV